MVTLIVKDNFNIFINEETGRWFCFDYALEDRVVKDINIDAIKELYSNYEEFESYLNEINKDNEPINDKLDDMNYLVLHSSDLCNMKCLYCYAEDNLCNNNCSLMSSDVMIKSINKFYKGKEFFVLFHGREPLMNYDNILETVKTFKDVKNIHFIVQTNGMLLNDKKIRELRNYNVIINVSVDGISDFSNSLRINGLERLNYTSRVKALIEKYKISPIIIIHKNNYNEIEEIMDYLIKNNIDGASFNFLWPTRENKELSKYVLSGDVLFETMKKVFDKSIVDSKFVFKERELYLLYGRILKRHINNYMCNRAPCGAGKNCLSVYKDGEIYPCTMVNDQKENYLGNLDNTIEEILGRDVVLKRRDINSIKDCCACPLRIFCKGGGCPGFIYNYSMNINEKSLYCEYYYKMILYIIKKIYKMSEEKYFINY